MSLRFGSGWLVIYFLICSCTLMCSAPSCTHEIVRRLILLNRSHSLSHRILEDLGHSSARAPRKPPLLASETRMSGPGSLQSPTLQSLRCTRDESFFRTHS